MADLTHASTRTDGEVASSTYNGRRTEADSTETRRSFATSEFWVFTILAVLIIFFTYESGNDTFAREDGWLYVTLLGIGYLISRGLAKAGSYERYVRERDH